MPARFRTARSLQGACHSLHAGKGAPVREGIIAAMAYDDRRLAQARWYWIGAIWCGVGLFEATQNVIVMHAEGMHHAWLKLFFFLLFSWIPWALVTPAVMRLGRRYPLAPLRSPGAWLRHAGAWLLIGLVATLWTAGLQEWLNPWTPDTDPPPLVNLWQRLFFEQLLSSLVLYFCILMAAYMLDSRDRIAQQSIDAARLGEQLSQAELATLRHQVEPHFLFNALNAVAGLVRTGESEAAVAMLARLSDFLRHVLQDSGRQEVRLEEELHFVKMYLAIQGARFAERLRVTIDVDDELGCALVPGLILQPIVENAIKHGIAQREEGGEIAIRAVHGNGRLTATICNDGPPLRPDWESVGAAIGLTNVRDRLRGLYGDAAAFEIANAGSAGVRVTISVPLRGA